VISVSFVSTIAVELHKNVNCSKQGHALYSLQVLDSDTHVSRLQTKSVICQKIKRSWQTEADVKANGNGNTKQGISR